MRNNFLMNWMPLPVTEIVCLLLLSDMKELFPQFSKLEAIVLVIPITSVPAEWGFSCQNRIKSKLTEAHAENLMLISMEGPPDSDLNDVKLNPAAHI
ncbi:hypothetical protein SNE40_018261 [Patella caerulea]|uniref:HAT C-terminal dimerisation domain-containing protein n=1 Tax=Patella caerulea TaxID=87958 RepID=A0AAN8PGW8_PATCE